MQCQEYFQNLIDNHQAILFIVSEKNVEKSAILK
jgi:hypothetical protein